ncbi:hypothetical protein Tco_0488757 [Tanacetum coccineum]
MKNKPLFQDGGIQGNKLGETRAKFPGVLPKGNALSLKRDTRNACMIQGSSSKSSSDSPFFLQCCFPDLGLVTYDFCCDDLSTAQADFEQSLVMDFTDNEISSDSNIIPYSQYLQETQHATVQDTNLQRRKPTLYDGVVIYNSHVAMPVIDDEETLILEEESRYKMFEKAKNLEVVA